MRRVFSCLVVLVASLHAGSASAQAPAELVKDLGPDLPAVAQFATAAVRAGSVWYFGEKELWRTDGTDTGTVLVKDINPLGNSLPDRFATDGHTIWFVADDGVHGREIWSSDGTAQGTTLYLDVVPGAVGSDPFSLRVIGNLLFFMVADPGGSPISLWRGDGTPGGTFALAHAAASPYLPPEAVGGTLLFENCDTICSLWSSDGTVAGTTMLADIGEVGTDLGGRLRFVAAGNRVYVINPTRAGGGSLWTTDGTGAGTTKVLDAPGPELGSDAILVNTAGLAKDGDLYFVTNTPVVPITGDVASSTLWRTNGSPGNATAIKQILRDPAYGTEYDSQAFIGSLIPVDDDVYFLARGYILFQDAGVYRTNGTAAGTSLTTLPKQPNAFYLVNGTPLFGTYDQLWITDGTPSGTHPITPHGDGAGVNGGMDVGDTLVIPSAQCNVPAFRRFALGQPGTSLLQPRPTVPTSGAPLGAPNYGDTCGGGSSLKGASAELAGSMLYAGTDSVSGSSTTPLWRTDGTDAGTYQLDTLTEPCLTRLGTRALFFRNSEELTATTGTVAGTQKLADVPNFVACPVVMGTSAYFSSLPTTQGALWKTNGTPAGTFQVVLFNAGAPDALHAVGNKLFFQNLSGNQLWVSDGTFPGTTILLNYVPNPIGAPPLEAMLSAGSNLIFGNMADQGLCAVWRSDGTAAGTYGVAYTGTAGNLYTGCGMYDSMATVGSQVLFFVNNVTEAQLWKTDGTLAGTTMVTGGIPGGGSLFVYLPSVVGTIGQHLIFVPTDGSVWTSDGTALGTHPLPSVPNDAFINSRYNALGSADGVFFLMGQDPEHGGELWRTDGTDAGTWLLDDVVKGPDSSWPTALGSLGTTVFFSAKDERHLGTSQLFKIENAGTCGNGTIEGTELCDDGNGDDGDACTTGCVPNVCGDGIVKVGVEECDDGNTLDGDCCSSSCMLDAAGTSCADDGDPCGVEQCDGAGACIHTNPALAGTVCRPGAGPCDVTDQCDGVNPTCPFDLFDETQQVCRASTASCDIEEVCSGTAAACPFDRSCTGGSTTTTSTTPGPTTTSTTIPPPLTCAPAPVSGCKRSAVPAKGLLSIKNSTKDAGDSLTWKWSRGPAVAPGEFGDPLNTHDYVLCLYEGSGNTLTFQARLPTNASGLCFPEPCWKAKGPTKFAYQSKPPSSFPDGVKSLLLQSGLDQKSKVTAKAKGFGLSNRPFGLPTPPLNAPLLVQLQSEAGTCFEGSFSTPTVNAGGKFKAKSD
ncbi:MAG TPA: DUF4215 domain-containing protein [Candidatus Eisenbacteria bacterium]|nr:DUF4215 domain-containing protein [Candidatus Eisenbacteria bacterium]